MPLPLVAAGAGAAAIAAIFGGLSAKEKFEKAEQLVQQAKEKYDAARGSLEQDRAATQKALEDLGKLKRSVFKHQIKHLLGVMSRHREARGVLQGFDERIFVSNLNELKSAEAKSSAMDSLLDVGAGGTLGAAAGVLAVGGLIAAPVLAAAGVLFISAKADRAVDEAVRYSRQVELEVERMAGIQAGFEGIRRAAAEQSDVIAKLVRRYKWAQLSGGAGKTVHLVARLAGRRAKTEAEADAEERACDRLMEIGLCLKKVLDVPVLMQDGSPNPHIRQQCSGYLEIRR
ncbi:MAG: hypothetical protein Q4F72_06050 [Desulfovibrionaceae bacterium]|nr:hypothetical protein [Desulfovibrionaceae bacterium]